MENHEGILAGMFGRNRVTIFALGLALLVSTALVVGAILDVFQYRQSQASQRAETTAYYDVPSDIDAEGFDLDRPDIVGLTRYIERANAAQEHERYAYNLQAQQDIALFTRALAWAAGMGIVVSVVGVGLIFQTLRATRDLTIETRRIGEAQVRAYVHDTKVKVTVRDDNTVEIAIECSNSGQSPAYDVVASVCINMEDPLHIHVGTIAAQSPGGGHCVINERVLIRAFDNGKSRLATLDMALFYNDVFKGGTLKSYHYHVMNWLEVPGTPRITVSSVPTPLKHFTDARMAFHERIYKEWIERISKPDAVKHDREGD